MIDPGMPIACNSVRACSVCAILNSPAMPMSALEDARRARARRPKYLKVRPYLINNDPPPEKERLQSPEERERLNGLYECILCAC